MNATAIVACNNCTVCRWTSSVLTRQNEAQKLTIPRFSSLPFHMDQPADNLPPLGHRNTIATPMPVPTLLNSVNANPLHTSSSLPKGADCDIELIPVIPSAASYTSLKDLLPSSPAAVSSPSVAASSPNSGYEISIRNRLVKQAAWAYLQPMASSPESSGHRFLHRVWLQLSAGNPFSCCLQFLSLLAGVFDRILRSIRIQLAR